MKGRIHIAGRTDGPFTVDEIRTMRKRGEVDERTGYRHHENDNLRKLGNLGAGHTIASRRNLVIAISGIAAIGLVALVLIAIKKGNDERSPQSFDDLLVMIMGLLMGACILAGVAGIYLLPTIVAQTNRHHQATAITALNILLGWTFVGWVVSLVWALTKPPRNPNTH